MKEIKFPTSVKYSVVLVGIVFTIYSLIVAKVILVPIVVSILLSLLLAPFANFLEKWKFPSTLASLISILSISIFFLGIGYFFYSQLSNLLNDLPFLEKQTKIRIDDLKEHLPENINAEDLGITQENAVHLLRTNSSYLSKNVMALIENISLFLLIPIYVFFMLQYRKNVEIFLKKIFSKNKSNEEIESILKGVRGVVRNYIVGMFWVILILIAMYSIAFFSLGIKHAFLFAVFAGSLNIIPYVGPLMGSLIPFVFAFITKDNIWIPFGVIITSYVIQLIESNFLTPKIVGGKVSMNPLITLVTLIIGLYVWGIAGMILFIPLAAILKVVFDHVESMEPYGYLMGDHKKKSGLVFAKLRKKVTKKQKKNNSNNENN